MANDVIGRELSPFDESQVAEIVKKTEAPLGREGSDLYPLRDQMRVSNWEKVGMYYNFIKWESSGKRRA